MRGEIKKIAAGSIREEMEKCLPHINKSPEQLAEAMLKGEVSYWNFQLARKLREGKISPEVLYSCDELAFKWAEEIGAWGAVVSGLLPDKGGPAAGWNDIRKLADKGCKVIKARGEYPADYREELHNPLYIGKLIFLRCYYDGTPVYASSGIDMDTALPFTPVYWHPEDPDAAVYPALKAIELM